MSPEEKLEKVEKICVMARSSPIDKLLEKNVFKGLHRNKLFLGIIGTTIVLQLVMVEFLKKFVDTKRLNWGQWGAYIIIAAISCPISWAVKFIPVPKKPLLSFLDMKKK